MEAGADMNQCRMRDGVTPLSIAVHNGHVEVVQALTVAGAIVVAH